MDEREPDRRIVKRMMRGFVVERIEGVDPVINASRVIGHEGHRWGIQRAQVIKPGNRAELEGAAQIDTVRQQPGKERSLIGHQRCPRVFAYLRTCSMPRMPSPSMMSMGRS